jgi:biotin carboxylase
MEGLSSQRDILLSVKEAIPELHLVASHRAQRPEILSVADTAYQEPHTHNDDIEKLSFIELVVKRHNVQLIHCGRNSSWFEKHRQHIESLGVKLITGASSTDSLALADDKFQYAQVMASHGLPVVESMMIPDVVTLERAIQEKPFGERAVCIKPVTGIYGLGFWRFDDSVSFMKPLNDPDSRHIHPEQYLHALRTMDHFEPLLLMPYLQGPERSVDMIVDKGQVLAAISRRKEGAYQHMELDGRAIELAKACAELMKADGLVNVQTRNDADGNPVLLEINMRPSGGICYTNHSGVNLPGLFAKYHLGMITPDEIETNSRALFHPAVVRSITTVLPVSMD